MSLSPDENVPVLATTAPSPVEKRDLLGNFCFYLHFAVMIFIVAGWAIPFAPGTLFLSGIPRHWSWWSAGGSNKNACITG